MTAATRWKYNLALAALLGCVYSFAIDQLFVLAAGRITVSVAEGAVSLGLAAPAVHLTVRLVNALLWAMIVGGLFGIALGLGVRKNVFVYWLAFVAAYLLVGICQALTAGLGMGLLLLVWTLPDTWLLIVSVLAFGHVSAQFLDRRRGKEGTVAP